MPDRLVYHVASLFKRSPVPAYEGELNFEVLMPGFPCKGGEIGKEESPLKAKEEETKEEDSTNLSIDAKKEWWTKVRTPTNDVAHFENLQSTNWNSLRFKSPPSVDTDIGWRVEFRPMDIQLTDFENAALTVFVGMMANIINTFSLDFILPISYVDINMLNCQDLDAVLK
jgi:hypothetical protein